MKELLQELNNLKKCEKYLDEKLYKTCKNHLYKEILKEFTTDYLNDIFVNKNNKKENISQRMEKLLGQVKNTTIYEKERNPKTGKIERQKSLRTNLQLENGNFCTKQEFEDEFLKYEFNDNIEAKRFLKQFTGLFNDEGWLIIENEK